MLYGLTYHKGVHKDLKKLSPDIRNRIKLAVLRKLSKNPKLGKPMRQTLKGYRSLRVYNYRVIYRVTNQTVFILSIAHRATVYNEAYDRLINL
jgi:mRNA interferase RelE/StbE